MKTSTKIKIVAFLPVVLVVAIKAFEFFYLGGPDHIPHGVA